MSKTKAEHAHMSGVAQLNCGRCDDWPVEIHHLFTGGGGRRDHLKVAPLCFECHRGSRAIDKTGKQRRFIETELMEYVMAYCGCDMCKLNRSI